MLTSKYFTLDELQFSPTARMKGIDNRVPVDYIFNIQDLVGNVLDPARERLGKPIYVNSGYRCDAVNEAVGGVAASQHREGKAADLRSDDPRELFKLIRDYLDFDQLILYPTFVHVSFNKHNNRRQFFVK